MIASSARFRTCPGYEMTSDPLWSSLRTVTRSITQHSTGTWSDVQERIENRQSVLSYLRCRNETS